MKLNWMNEVELDEIYLKTNVNKIENFDFSKCVFSCYHPPIHLNPMVCSHIMISYISLHIILKCIGLVISRTCDKIDIVKFDFSSG